MKRYYEILELPPNASPRRIKEQYRRLAKRYHPDRISDAADKAHYAAKFREINEAYEALSEIVKRGNLKPHERKLDFLYHQGYRFFEEKQWSRALTVFTQILAIDPAYRDARSRLSEARRRYRQLTVLYAQADDHFRRRQWGEALAGFEAVLQESPGYRDAALKLKHARREQRMQSFLKQY